MSGHRSVDELEEAQKILVAVAWVVLGNDRSGGDVRGDEQAGGAVMDVVVRYTLRDGGPDRQHLGTAVQCFVGPAFPARGVRPRMVAGAVVSKAVFPLLSTANKFTTRDTRR